MFLEICGRAFVVSKEMEITVTNQRIEPIDMLSEKPVISNVK